MARKQTFGRDEVLQAALDVVARKGIGGLTARRVARQLGASTAPVYSNFASMDTLLEAVRGRLQEMILDYCRRPWSDDAFLNMGIGYVRFASEHPRLFRALNLEQAGQMGREQDVLTTLAKDLDAHPFLGGLPQDHKDELLFQASIFTLGIATTVVTGRWPDPDLPTVERWLRSVGGLLARAALDAAGLPVPPELDKSLGAFVVPWRRPARPGMEDGADDSTEAG